MTAEPRWRTLYLDLLKRSLTGAVHQDSYSLVRTGEKLVGMQTVDALSERGIELVQRRTGQDRTALVREGRGGWPLVGETMIGLRRLTSLQRCVDNVLDDDVPGDLIEAGVWRGGAGIFMRGMLKARGVGDRTVWLADSFRGLPPPDAERYPADAHDRHHTHRALRVSASTVRANFRRYGLLDDQVRIVEGWFSDTLPTLAGLQWAVVRIDGDMYGSTMESLCSLYPDLSVGGYLIVDDYGAIPAAARAVDDFREEHGIREPIKTIDWTGILWRRDR